MDNLKKQNSPIEKKRKIKKLRNGEDETATAIPLVVRIIIVGVQVKTIVITTCTKHV